MAGKHCDEGRNRVLNQLYKDTAVDATLYLGLYENDTEPDTDDTLTDLTEQSGNGYARIALTRGTDWTVTDDVATCAKKTFTADGGDWGNQYGYFICTCASGTEGKLLYVEHFDNGPFNVPDGGTVDVTPSVDCSDPNEPL